MVGPRCPSVAALTVCTLVCSAAHAAKEITISAVQNRIVVASTSSCSRVRLVGDGYATQTTGPNSSPPRASWFSSGTLNPLILTGSRWRRASSADEQHVIWCDHIYMEDALGSRATLFKKPAGSIIGFLPGRERRLLVGCSATDRRFHGRNRMRALPSRGHLRFQQVCGAMVMYQGVRFCKRI